MLDLIMMMTIKIVTTELHRDHDAKLDADHHVNARNKWSFWCQVMLKITKTILHGGDDATWC